MRARFAAVLLAAGLMTISCGGITDPSNNSVQTSSGAFAPGGQSAGIPFTASNGGELTVRITALAPNAQTYVGIYWLQDASGGACSSYGGLLYQSQFAQVNVPAITGSQINKGQYCIVLYDSVGLSQTETFTIQISHP
jgi:hypothetical protein